MRKMVVFDLDGTLLDTLGDLADAGNHALAQQGFPIHETEKYKYFVGNGIPKLIERILPERTAEPVKNETYKLFCSYYNKTAEQYQFFLDIVPLFVPNYVYK